MQGWLYIKHVEKVINMYYTINKSHFKNIIIIIFLCLGAILKYNFY